MRHAKEKRIIVIGWRVSERGEQTREREREIRDLNFIFCFFFPFFPFFFFLEGEKKKVK